MSEVKERFKFPENWLVKREKEKNKRDMRKKILKSDFPTYTNNRVKKGDEGMVINPVLYSILEHPELKINTPTLENLSKEDIELAFNPYNYLKKYDILEEEEEDKNEEQEELKDTSIISNYKPKSNEEYAQTMEKVIKEALLKIGINSNVWAKYLTALTCIESGWGRSELSTKYNNYGGIKGKDTPLFSTKEWSPSKGYYTILDRFKAFNSMLEYANYFVDKLKDKFGAFDGTPLEYLKNIRKHGYFTSPLSEYTQKFNKVLKQIS